MKRRRFLMGSAALSAASLIRPDIGTCAGSSTPTFRHVYLVLEENHGYGSVIDRDAMPYLNSLAREYGQATQYYANTHPSIGNYFMLTTGQIITNDDDFKGLVTADNIVRQLTAAGKTWKCYAESLPYAGYLGDNAYPYDKAHNPFAYFSDVVSNAAQARNIVPCSQFASDVASGATPIYSFIVPNLLNDAHDAPLARADGWLRANTASLISSAFFRKDGLLIIVFDEAEKSDVKLGGGHVVWVVVSAKAKPSYRSNTVYQHQSTLRFTMTALGLTNFPGAAGTAPDMTEFLTPASAADDPPPPPAPNLDTEEPRG